MREKMYNYCCPVCQEVNPSQKCPQCGFDGSCNYEEYPTFGRIDGGRHAVSWYREQQENVLHCNKCRGTRFCIILQDLSYRCVSCGERIAVEPVFQNLKAKKPANEKTVTQMEYAAEQGDVEAGKFLADYYFGKVEDKYRTYLPLRPDDYEAFKSWHPEFQNAVRWAKYVVMKAETPSPQHLYIVAADMIASNAGNSGMSLLRRAAEQGSYRAQKLLGFCLEKGIFCVKNVDDARKWKEKSEETKAIAVAEQVRNEQKMTVRAISRWCEVCGASNSPGAVYCASCGKRLCKEVVEGKTEATKRSERVQQQATGQENKTDKKRMTQFCTKCGGLNLTGAIYCNSCGEKLR